MGSAGLEVDLSYAARTVSFMVLWPGELLVVQQVDVASGLRLWCCLRLWL